jgi:hypothetical protein
VGIDGAGMTSATARAQTFSYSASGRAIDVTIPWAYRHSGLTAASHTFQVKVDIEWYNSANAKISYAVNTNSITYGIVEEIKV